MSLLGFLWSTFSLSFKGSVGTPSIHISVYDLQYGLDIDLGGGQPITNSQSLLVLGKAVDNKFPVAKAFVLDGVQNLQCMDGRTTMKGMVWSPLNLTLYTLARRIPPRETPQCNSWMCAGLKGDESMEVLWWENKCPGTSGMYDPEPLQTGQGIAGDLGTVGSSTMLSSPPFQVEICRRPQSPQFVAVEVDHHYGRTVGVDVDFGQWS